MSGREDPEGMYGKAPDGQRGSRMRKEPGRKQPPRHAVPASPELLPRMRLEGAATAGALAGDLRRPPLNPGPLSPREMEVLELVADGKSTRQIAAHLGIAFKTAACHRANIMAKLEVHETASLVRCAIRLGLIEP